MRGRISVTLLFFVIVELLTLVLFKFNLFVVVTGFQHILFLDGTRVTTSFTN